MKIRTVIADDEPLARARLNRLLSQNESIEIVGVAENGSQAVELSLQHKPDLIFLDIQMPIKTGITAAKEIVDQSNNSPSIVFCTAYDEYAINAFELNAAAYLLKPVSAGDLNNAVKKASQLSRLQLAAMADLEKPKTVVISQHGTMQRINLDEVCYFRSEEKQVIGGLLSGDEIIVDLTLSELEQKYSESLLRLHRSCLVNRDKLKALVKEDGHDFVELNDCSQRFAVSRRSLVEVKNAFKTP